MDRRRVQPLDTSPRDRIHARDGQSEPGVPDPDGVLLLTPDRVEHLRSQLLNAITDDNWAEAAAGFEIPELASE